MIAGINMASSDLLFVPGWNGSGPEHWQTLWQRELGAATVEQRDWANPEPHEWAACIGQHIRRHSNPVVLVAHSLGVLTVVRWALSEDYVPVAGAFLVAPPDPEACEAASIRHFANGWKARPLAFPALLTGSENDPYATLTTTARMADAWSCEFWNAGRAGHINVASGHGPWPQGRAQLARLLDRLAVRDDLAA